MHYTYIFIYLNSCTLNASLFIKVTAQTKVLLKYFYCY